MHAAPAVDTAKRSVVFSSALLMMLGAGCTTPGHQVKVDAIARQEGARDAQSYVLRTRGPAAKDDSLRSREATEFIRTALSGKGLYEAPSAERADLVIEVDYGVEAPRSKIERVTVPIYAQVGGGVRYGTVAGRDAQGNAVQRSVAVYEPPRTEIVGYDEVPRLVTVYEKYLKISARENRSTSEGRPPPELWTIHASTEDESKDIRKYLPIIASATIDFVGEGATAEKTVKVRADGPGVDFIRKGMGQPVVPPVVPAPRS
jgi:hypothetical protein